MPLYTLKSDRLFESLKHIRNFVTAEYASAICLQVCLRYTVGWLKKDLTRRAPAADCDGKSCRLVRHSYRHGTEVWTNRVPTRVAEATL